MGIHSDSVYLQHILEAISRLFGYIRGMDYDQFKQDEKTVRAVLYDLALIGEAARRISEPLRKSHPDIPWKMIWDMRNVLIHDYVGVEYPTVWKTLQIDIPELKKMIEEII